MDTSKIIAQLFGALFAGLIGALISVVVGHLTRAKRKK